MQVRKDHVPNFERMHRRELHVLIDVALRIDDHRRVRFLVANDVRSVSQTGKVELFKDHDTPGLSIGTSAMGGFVL
jgi:hypothetical protein